MRQSSVSQTILHIVSHSANALSTSVANISRTIACSKSILSQALCNSVRKSVAKKHFSIAQHSLYSKRFPPARRITSYSSLRASLNLSDRWGYHIRPIHYYEPMPDFRSITAEQIKRRRAFPAIDFRWDAQAALLNELSTYRDELTTLEFDFNNGFFSGFDAAVYYSLIRHLKPQRIIEIGGGYSTRIAGKALAANRQRNAHLHRALPGRATFTRGSQISS